MENRVCTVQVYHFTHFCKSSCSSGPSGAQGPGSLNRLNPRFLRHCKLYGHVNVVTRRVHPGWGGKNSCAFTFPAVERQRSTRRHVSAVGVQTQGAIAGRRRQRSAVDPLQRRRWSDGHVHGDRHATGWGETVRWSGHLSRCHTSSPTAHDPCPDQGKLHKHLTNTRRYVSIISSQAPYLSNKRLTCFDSCRNWLELTKRLSII